MYINCAYLFEHFAFHFRHLYKIEMICRKNKITSEIKTNTIKI